MNERNRKNELDRREAIALLVAGGASLVGACKSHETAGSNSSTPLAGETPMPVPTSLAGNHSPVPLAFKPGALNGISEKMIVSHHDNNYVGAVKNLNRVEQDLAKITTDTPPFMVAALRDKELTFRNSKSLHESYFANLGGDGKLGGDIEKVLSQAYGSSSRFLDHFKATAMGLGGGSGWVVLGYELDTGALRTVASGNHTQQLAQSLPILVLDVYEHAYQMDYGAAIAKYIDAFLANVNYEEVNKRWKSAERVASALKATTR